VGLKRPGIDQLHDNGRKHVFDNGPTHVIDDGLEPDLLDELAWSSNDHYWQYALYAAVALIRIAAEHQKKAGD
jgi:hypothetical protein